MKINPSDISVIVQGAVDKKLTPICLHSIRKILPRAEIVLSTWDGTDVSGLDYDKLVLNKDPGNIVIDEVYNVSNNVNRQIISTKQGLFAATKPYALKIRSDMALNGTGFIKEFCKYYFSPQPADDKIFEHRIVINNLYCANPYKTCFSFHISDWCQFGLTTDLLNLWDIPLESKAQQQYFKSHPKPPFDPMPTWIMRFIPEQYILMTCLRKNNITPGIKWYADRNATSRELSERIFATNIIIMDYEDFGIKFMKFDPYKWDYKKQYSNLDWMGLYKKYIDSKFVIVKTKKYKVHLQKHYAHFMRPIKACFKWLGEPLAVLYYAIMYVGAKMLR